VAAECARQGAAFHGKLAIMPGVPGPTLLEAERITRRTPEGETLLADVSLTVAAGERVGIEGPTGAGKSLLLRALSLLDPIEGGALEFRGSPLADGDVPAYRSRVAYLHQSPALVEGTVEENLRLPFALRVYRDRSFDRERAVELLGALGQEPSFLAKRREDLSGGERQVTALVRLLQLGPEVLLLDEPTASLDPASTTLAEELLVRWVEAGERAAVWVTHDPAQADRVATRWMRLAGGRLAPADDRGRNGGEE